MNAGEVTKSHSYLVRIMKRSYKACWRDYGNCNQYTGKCGGSRVSILLYIYSTFKILTLILLVSTPKGQYIGEIMLRNY